MTQFRVLAADVAGIVVLVTACGGGQSAGPASVPPPVMVPGPAATQAPSSSYASIYIPGRVLVRGFDRCLAEHGSSISMFSTPGRLTPAEVAAINACSKPSASPSASPPKGR